MRCCQPCCAGKGPWVVRILTARGYDTSKDQTTINGPFMCRVRAELFAANSASNLKWGSKVTIEEAQ